MAERVWEDEENVCVFCWGEGYIHDCGEDTCCCLCPFEPNVKCHSCNGTGVASTVERETS